MQAIRHNGRADVRRQIYCKESYKDGRHHYHLPVKIGRQKGRLFVRNCFDKRGSVNVNFSHKQVKQYDAWHGVTKTGVV